MFVATEPGIVRDLYILMHPESDFYSEQDRVDATLRLFLQAALMAPLLLTPGPDEVAAGSALSATSSFREAAGSVGAASRSSSWSAVRAELGKELSLPPYTEVHHWLVPQGGTGRLTFRGFFENQWGRFVPERVRNSRWNLMVPPEHALGPMSRIWHQGLHGQGLAAQGMGGRLWYGSPTWAKAAAGGIPLSAGAITYALEW